MIRNWAYLSGADGTRADVVDSCNNELRDSADGQPDHEENAATTDLGDYAGVDNDDDDTDGRKNTGVLEGITDLGHLEEVCSVSFIDC